jgi:integrase
MVKSKRRRSKDKPAKPYPDFPLFPHATRRWAKKIRGKLYYFGSWKDGPDAALIRYLAEKDALFAGRKPRPQDERFTVKDLCNKFLKSKRRLVDAGEMKQRTLDEYESVTDRIIEAFGRERAVEDLRPEDFEQLRARLAPGWGPVTLTNVMQRIKSVFKYASDNVLIPRPVVYGQGFKRPSQKMLRKARNEKGPRMFEAHEIRDMLKGALVVGKDGPELVRAGAQLRAMILLGINCGFGNNDCGSLPLTALNLERGWVNFPRPKTEVARRCPLWPETIEAIQEALARRPVPKTEAAKELVFVTKFGDSWTKDTIDNPISKETRKLLDQLGINGNRNFYALRHTFETIAGETDRQTAVDFIMGHAPKSDDMSAVYRERISDERLQAVTDYVRQWLFGPDQEAKDAGQEEE